MTAETIWQLEKQHVWHPFTPMDAWCAAEHEPLLLDRGQGCWLYDQQGKAYLDGNSSIWTNIHGHQHPTINAAIQAQLARVAHTSYLGFSHSPSVELAKALVDLMPGPELQRVFYSDNGSTSIEAAVRMALQYQRQIGALERQTVVAFDRGYHGDTLGAASLGGLPMFKGAANDFGYNVIRIADAAALGSLDASHIAAVVIEPLIQGAAGMRTWPVGMLSELRRWTRENGVLLILDEIMTGFGRTGKMFACQHEDVVPDMLCLAKGLTGGYLPLAVTITTPAVFDAFRGDAAHAFYYGHSYTANQLGCAAALGSLQVFREEGVIASLPAKVSAFTAVLEPLKAMPQVLELRQCGLIAGIELHGPVGWGAKICLAARANGLLTRPVGNVVVLMPPLCATDAELGMMVTALEHPIHAAPHYSQGTGIAI
jgi:adenosylmethionine-8-amino-7-oxononanoate aminotransferase